jgi:hypothetical protein
MTRAPLSQGCDHIRTPRRLRPITPAQIQPPAILRSQLSRKRAAGRKNATKTHDGLPLTGYHEPTPSSRIQGTHASKSP